MLAPWRKGMTNLDSILESIDITFVDKGPSSKAVVFPVAMYGCESWTIKKAEHWGTDAFELWCWRRKTLESPLDCKEIQTVNPKGNPVLNSHWKDWCWSWSSNTLATWCEELTHWKRPWCWERLGAGGEGADSGWDGWMASLTRWTWVWASSGSWWQAGKPGVLQSMGSQRVGHDWAAELNYVRLQHHRRRKIGDASGQTLFTVSPFFYLEDLATSDTSGETIPLGFEDTTLSV